MMNIRALWKGHENWSFFKKNFIRVDLRAKLKKKTWFIKTCRKVSRVFTRKKSFLEKNICIQKLPMKTSERLKKDLAVSRIKVKQLRWQYILVKRDFHFGALVFWNQKQHQIKIQVNHCLSNLKLQQKQSGKFLKKSLCWTFWTCWTSRWRRI